jgi:hypothetical protein
MNLEEFFDHIRGAVFGGKLSQQQVDGISKILTYRDTNYKGVTNDQLAYILATVTWETGHAMVPVKEAGSAKYLRSKPYYPWIGMGLVQVTWEENAKKFGAKKPEDLLAWPVSLRACFEGMVRGMFTGKKLSDYIVNGRCDYVGARRIINGQDKAKVIANIARSYQYALKVS